MAESAQVNPNITAVPDSWHPASALDELSKLAAGAETIVEIGTWLGHSAIALAKRAAGHVYCVDHWRGSHSGTGTVDDPLALYIRFLERIDDENLCSEIVPLYGESGVVWKLFEHKPIDVLYIDGDHRYDAVMADLHYWAPLVRAGGIICGDDYGEVKRAVLEYFTGRKIDVLAKRIWTVQA